MKIFVILKAFDIYLNNLIERLLCEKPKLWIICEVSKITVSELKIHVLWIWFHLAHRPLPGITGST